MVSEGHAGFSCDNADHNGSEDDYEFVPNTSSNAASAAVKDIANKINALPAESLLDLLQGVRSIRDQLENQVAEKEVAVTNFRASVSEKLDKLRRMRSELQNMKDEVQSLNSSYVANAKIVIEKLQQMDPTILIRLEQLSRKQKELEIAKFELAGKDVVEKCRAHLISSATLSSLEFLETALIAAFAHKTSAHNWNKLSLIDFDAKLSVLLKDVRLYLESYIEKILTRIQYPFSEVVDERSIADDVALFCQILVVLFRIEEGTTPGSGEQAIYSVLFTPISKRFRFHFYGDRKTNDPLKPEWFLQALLMWLQSIPPFFFSVTEVVGRKIKLNVMGDEFFQINVSKLAIEKITDCLKNVLIAEDDLNFAHLLDECVDFETQRADYDLNQCGENTLSPFCKLPVLESWLKMEQDFCTARIDVALTSRNKWALRFRELSDADIYSVCECADVFVALIHGIQQRSRYLPDDDAKRRFIDLQLVLVDEFLQRLTQISRGADSPWSEPFPEIMNAVWYLRDVISEWSEFAISDGVISSGGHSGVFDSSLEIYSHMWNQMLDGLLNSCKVQLSDLIDQYQEQSWCYAEDKLIMGNDISPYFCVFLNKTRSLFAKASERFSKASLKRIFEAMLRIVSSLLKKDVMERTVFSAAGATQMLFDVEKGLLPVLNSIFSRSGIEELHALQNEDLLTVLNGLRLLSCNWGVATLLREEIKASPDEVVADKLAAMHITNLDKTYAETLLKRRLDLSKNTDGGFNLR